MAQFKVGGRVVALVDNFKKGRWIKGEIYTVQAIQKRPCGCITIQINFEITPDTDILSECYKHPGTGTLKGIWASVDFFAPIEETFHRMTFKEVVEAVVSCEN